MSRRTRWAGAFLAALLTLVGAALATAEVNQWVPVPTITAGARGWQQTSHNPSTGVAVVFGGSASTYQNDTVEINLKAGGTQKIIFPHPDMTPGHPRGRDGHSLVYVPAWQRHALLGGWAGQTNPPSSIGVTEIAVYDEAGRTWERRLVDGYAGTDSTGIPTAIHPDGWLLAPGHRLDPGCRRWYRTDFSREPDAAGWWGKRKLLTSAGPCATANFANAMTYVPTIGKFFLLWGSSGQGSISRASLYDPGTNTWTEIGNSTQSPFPAYREQHAVVYEPKSGLVLVSGGQTVPRPPTVKARYGDVWSWNPKTGEWRDLNAALGIPTLDHVHQTLIAPGEGVVWMLPLGRKMVLDVSAMREPGPRPAPKASIPLSPTVAAASVASAPASAQVRGPGRVAEERVPPPAPPAVKRVAAADTKSAPSADPPPPSGDFPRGVWTPRPWPSSVGGCIGACKHMRGAVMPSGKVSFVFGDHRGSGAVEYSLDSGRQEMYEYDVKTGVMTLTQPFCRPDGGPQPSGPDEHGWVLDTKRNLFWFVPGYQWNRTAPDSKGHCAGNVYGKIMTYDPATNKWAVPDIPAPSRPVKLGSGWTTQAVYDAPSDSLLMLYYDGGSGAAILRYYIGDGRWTHKSANEAHTRWSDTLPAYDPDGRVIYVIPEGQDRLFSFHVATETFENLGSTPSMGYKVERQPVWATRHKKLLVPVRTIGAGDVNTLIALHVYDPRTKTWTTPPMTTAPPGQTVHGRHAIWLEAHDAMLVWGRGPIWFWRP